MDIKNVTLKQKRYSTYGWNDKDPSTGRYINTLDQGEIGILLGSNGQPVTARNSNRPLNTVLEVRIGSEDGQYFFNATVLSVNTSEDVDYCVKTFIDRGSLPSMGNLNTLYVVKNENAIYRWDDDSMHMVKITGNDWHEIEEIYGGDSSYSQASL